jgi:hypothetical protein
MSLIRHLVWSDVRRFHWLIAGLMAVTAVSTALDGFMPEFATDRAALASLGMTAVVLWVAEGLLAALLIARVVQGDRLVGTTAFWFTRPINPIMLFAAKASTIGLVTLVWPVLCEAVLMAFHRVPVGQILLGAIQDFGWRALLVFALMSAAAITANITRYVILCASVVVAAAIGSAVYALAEKDRGSVIATVTLTVAGSSTFAFSPRAVYDHTADILRVVLTLVSLIALVVIQYRHRSIRKALLIGVAGVAVSIAAASLGPPSVVRADSRPPAWTDAETALSIGIDARSMEVMPTMDFGLPAGAVKVSARAQLSGVAPAWLASSRLAHATVTLADGSSINGLPFPRGFLLPEDFYGPGQVQAVKQVLGVRSLGDERYASGGMATLFLARREDVTRLASGPASYRGSFEIDLTQLTVASTLPLTRGATFQEGSYRLAIGEITPLDGALIIGVRSSDLQTVFDRQLRPSYSFYLRNRDKSEAAGGMLVSEGTGHLVPFLFGLHLYRSSSAGFTVYPGQLHFRASPGQRHIEADLTEEWLKGAELVIVRSKYEGTVERTVALDGLQVKPRTF